jgi:hypothetical protein
MTKATTTVAGGNEGRFLPKSAAMVQNDGEKLGNHYGCRGR